MKEYDRWLNVLETRNLLILNIFIIFVIIF